MKAHSQEFSIEKMAEIFKVSRCGYYEFLSRKPSKRASDNEVLTWEIKNIHKESRGMIAKFLESQGVSPDASWRTAMSGKGAWRLARTQGVHRGMRDKWWESIGYQPLRKLWGELTGNLKETAVYGNVRTVV